MAGNVLKCMRCGRDCSDVPSANMQCPDCGGRIFRVMSRNTVKRIETR